MSVTHYIPNSSGWASQRVNWAESSDGNGMLRLQCVRTYDENTNKSTLVLKAFVYSTVSSGVFQVRQGSRIKVNGSTLFTFPQSTLYTVTVNQDSTWRQIQRYTGDPNPDQWEITLSHDADGALSADIAVELSLTYTVGGTVYAMHWTNSGTLAAQEPRASGIASVTNPVNTLDTLTVTMDRKSTAFYHKATVKKGSATLYTSGAFGAALNLTVPRSWFTNFGSVTSLSCTVTVQTYTDSSCTTAVGDPVTAGFTVKADSGMKPVLQSGYAAAAPYNTGTAAANITGYVSGISKAQVTLDSAKLDMSAAVGAGVSSIKVKCGSAEATSAPYITGVLTGTATITVTVTDTRGRSATQTLTVQTMPYAPPTISQAKAYRCDVDGNEDEDGTYSRHFAVAGCSSLNGQNSVKLYVRNTHGGGSPGSWWEIAGGQWERLGSGNQNPDLITQVEYKAVDSLGTYTIVSVLIPGRIWAMKFRASGLGVGFGMKPTQDRVLELPAGWKIVIGGTVVAQG